MLPKEYSQQYDSIWSHEIFQATVNLENRYKGVKLVRSFLSIGREISVVVQPDRERPSFVVQSIIAVNSYIHCLCSKLTHRSTRGCNDCPALCGRDTGVRATLISRNCFFISIRTGIEK